MANTVVLTETFSTWAAASAAKNRLAQSGGFQRYGIRALNVERARDDFELRIEADAAHRDEIEHLLRTGAPLYTRPKHATWPEPGLISPVAMLGIAAAAGIVVYRILSRSSRKDLRAAARSTPPPREHVSPMQRQDWQHEADQRAGIRSHEQGYAI
jgi:hypothetical protein